MTPRHHHRRRAAALAAVVSLVLVGCAPDLPQPHPEAAPAVAPPTLTTDQSERVLVALGKTLTDADGALSADSLKARLSGPALASRSAEYSVSKTTSGAKGLTALPTKAQTLVVPSTEAWPRTEFVVTTQPDDLSSPRLLVLQQADPRSQYTLWGWARLLPGVKMPATAAPTTGSAPVAPDAKGLAATPTDVVSQYADVLLNGDKSTHAKTFTAADSYRKGIVNGREPLANVAKQASGKFTETYAPVKDQTFALATADGGALVVAGMSTVSDLTFSGASLSPPPELVAVSGGKLKSGVELRNSLKVTYADVVAFYIPPAAKKAQVQVLGAEHIRTSVTGS
ncbi:hypothetical protein [Pengzhenrongella sp.]|jgi:hypothetical protein|uniref:hypothetical protein n=1 Tax=Pengzhenrongella sp. TaxID=2888820 RepID=UPI002F927E31